VHRAAHILGNEAGESAIKVQRRFDGLVAAITRHRAKAGSLAGAIEHFGKVTRSYRPGLFHCYAVPDLPRTDNGLEQLFGSQRYHERRATGRKMASPAIVLRGEVRVIAATASREAASICSVCVVIHCVRWAARRAVSMPNPCSPSSPHKVYAPALPRGVVSSCNNRPIHLPRAATRIAALNAPGFPAA
jgi:hypothetical protein